MESLRVIVRLIGLLLWGTPLVLCLVLSRVLVPFAPKLAARIHWGLYHLFNRGNAVILGVQIEVEGQVPEPPFVMASNHLSYLDILAYGTCVQGYFVAKSEIASWPLLGALSRLGGTLFIQRDRKRHIPEVVAAMGSVFEQGDGVIFFPEGTSSRGEEVLPFKPSLFEIAARADVPVRAAAVTYEYAVAPLRSEDGPQYRVCWWGDAPFTPHFLELLKVPGIRARLSFDPVAIEGDDRKELCQRAFESVRGLFRPVPHYETECLPLNT